MTFVVRGLRIELDLFEPGEGTKTVRFVPTINENDPRLQSLLDWYAEELERRHQQAMLVRSRH